MPNWGSHFGFKFRNIRSFFFGIVLSNSLLPFDLNLPKLSSNLLITLTYFDKVSARYSALTNSVLSADVWYSEKSGANVLTKAPIGRLNPGEQYEDTQIKIGFAKDYVNDKSISSHSDVIFSNGFETDSWADDWGVVTHYYSIIENDTIRKFRPFINKSFSFY